MVKHWTEYKYEFWESGRTIRFEFNSKPELIHFLLEQNDDQFAVSQQKDSNGTFKWFYSTPRANKYWVDQIA